MKRATKQLLQYGVVGGGVLAMLVLAWPAQVYAQNIQITGAEDYNFGSYSVGDGAQMIQTYFCVTKDSGSTQWNATVDGSGTASAYTVQSAGGDTIPYAVQLKGTTPSPGVQETNLDGADNTAPLDCDGVDDQLLKVTINAVDLNSVHAGTYTGTLSVQVAP